MRRIAVAAAVLVLAGGVAQAGPVTFTDRAAFDAAVGASQLFTDFAVTYVPLTYDFTGTYGALTFQTEATDFVYGETLGVRGEYETGYLGLSSSLTVPVRAIGFDVVSATRWTGQQPTFPPVFPEIVPTTLSFGFRTTSGDAASYAVAPGSFFGALLFDDAFQVVSFATVADCRCHTGFAIDNLAVQAQSVPESSTRLLLWLGLLAVTIGARKL